MADLIDRQVAIDAIYDTFCYAYCDNCENEELRWEDDSPCEDCYRKYQSWRASRATIERAINSLPSVQPETAKRIIGKSRDGMTLWYQCDMCNEPVDAQDAFCRGCGRRLTDG